MPSGMPSVLSVVSRPKTRPTTFSSDSVCMMVRIGPTQMASATPFATSTNRYASRLGATPRPTTVTPTKVTPSATMRMLSRTTLAPTVDMNAPPSNMPMLHPSSLAASLSEAVVRLMNPRFRSTPSYSRVMSSRVRFIGATAMKQVSASPNTTLRRFGRRHV